MPEARTQASCCVEFVSSAAENCKLPLLDGNNSKSIESISTEIEIPKAGNVPEGRQGIDRLFHGSICTAWALLLRCFTGQDRITFEYKSNNQSATVSLFQMTFDENETLSKHLEKATDAFSYNQIKRSIVADAGRIDEEGSKVSNYVNTTVSVDDSDRAPDILGAKNSADMSEVSCGISTFSITGITLIK